MDRKEPIMDQKDKEYFEDKSKLHNILPNLYLTSLWGAKDLEKLRQHKVTHILIAAREQEIKFPKVFQNSSNL